MKRKSPDNYPSFPGMGPEEKPAADAEKLTEARPEATSRQFEHLVEDCPGCGNGKGSNPDTCFVCANYARKPRK